MVSSNQAQVGDVVRSLSWLDTALSIIVLIGACGHVAGSLASYPPNSEVLVYALGVAVLGWTCGFANLTRVRRPSDRPVALIALLTSLGQASVAVAWGFAIGHPFDPRVLVFSIAAGGLAILSARTAIMGHKVAAPRRS